MSTDEFLTQQQFRCENSSFVIISSVFSIALKYSHLICKSHSENSCQKCGKECEWKIYVDPIKHLFIVRLYKMQKP
jgi:hypothetical protein